MFKTLSRGAAAVAFMASFAMPAWADTITVTDTLDRTVEIPADPQRLLLGFYFEDFLAVAGPDAYDRVVAISKDTWAGWRNLQWQTYAAAIPRLEKLADVGEVDAGTFSLEAVVAAKPDVAVLAAWQYNALGDVAERIEAAGIPVVVLDYNAQTVGKHVQSTLLLGQIMGLKNVPRRWLTNMQHRSLTLWPALRPCLKPMRPKFTSSWRVRAKTPSTTLIRAPNGAA